MSDTPRILQTDYSFSENINQAEKTSRWFCWFCGSNGKTQLHKIQVASNKSIFVCPACWTEKGRDSGVISEFKKGYNPAQTFCLSNLQLTAKILWLEKKLSALQQKISEKEALP